MGDALRDQLSPDVLGDLAARWGGRADSCTLLGDTVNRVYAMHAGDQSLILRIAHDSRRSQDRIYAELNWIEHLAGAGITVCRPRPSLSGSLTETCQVADGSMIAAAFESAPGRKPGRADLTRPHMVSLGSLLGTIHAASANFTPPAGVADRVNTHRSIVRQLSAVDADACELFSQTLEHFASLPRDPSCFGMIHNDCQGANYHIHGDDIWLFDFDNCTQHWLVNDIACTWYFSLAWTCASDMDIWRQVRNPMVAALLEGYSRHCRVDRFWVEQLPLFLRYRSLCLYAYLRYRYDARMSESARAKIERSRSHAFAALDDAIG